MRFAAELEQLGGDHLIAEVSSIGLALGRVHGFHFHTAVFTNLTRDHLDFHRTDGRVCRGQAPAVRSGGGSGSAVGVLNSRTDPLLPFRMTTNTSAILRIDARRGSSGGENRVRASTGCVSICAGKARGSRWNRHWWAESTF